MKAVWPQTNTATRPRVSRCGPNKRMQLKKLRAAPERQDKVPPRAPAGELDGGTASQLTRSVQPTTWRMGARCGASR
jgi:hypothetical protein